MNCAIAGVQPELSGFNGSRPGPELQVRKGDSLKNRVENDLQDGALVHRHGLRVSIRMGGGITSLRPDAALIVDSTSPMRDLLASLALHLIRTGRSWPVWPSYY